MAANSNFPAGMSEPTQWVNYIMGKENAPKSIDQANRKEATSSKVYRITKQIFPSLENLQLSYTTLRSLKELVANPKKLNETLAEETPGSITAIFEEANRRYLGDEKKRSKFEKNLDYAILTIADELSSKMGYGRLQLKDTDKLTDQLIQKLPIDFQAEGFHNMLHMLLWPPPNEAKALAVLDRPGAKDLISRMNIEEKTPLHYAIYSNAASVVEKMVNMLSLEEFKQLPHLDIAFKQNFLNMLEAAPVEEPESIENVSPNEAKRLAEQQKEFEHAEKIGHLLEAKAGDDIELKELIESVLSEIEKGI